MRSLVILSAAATLALASCSNGNRGAITASGTIEGTDVNIGSEVMGKVRELRVDEGTRVAPGDTLVIIDDTEYQIQLRQAQANLESFAAQYQLTVEGSRKEDVVQAEANFKNAEGDYQRMKELLASQTVSQKQYDDAYTRYISAQQTYEKLKTGSRAQEIVNARVKRDYAAAQVDLLKKKVKDCYILAPSAGTVTLKGVEPGELVTVGANLLRVTQLDPVKLTIYVGEADLGKVRLGQKAEVRIDAYDKGKTFNGVVTYISPVAEFTPKNVQTKEERTKLVFGVKIEVQNADGALKPGLPADATIPFAGGA